MSSEITPIDQAGQISAFDTAGGLILCLLLVLALTVAAMALTR